MTASSVGIRWLVLFSAAIALIACGNRETSPDDGLDRSAIVGSLYNRSCIACHASGAAGAPRSHDVGAWSLLIEKDRDELLRNVRDGYNAMPPRGMCNDCSDQDYWDLIEFMARVKNK